MYIKNKKESTMTRYFNDLKSAKKELDNQINRVNLPRMGSRIIYGDKYYITPHVEECECGICPTLQNDGSLKAKD